MRKKFFYFYGVLSLVSFLASGIYIFTLPKTVATHWDFDGVANTHGSPYLFFIISAVPFITVILQALLYKFSPVKNSKGEKAFIIISGCIVCFMLVSTWVFILSAQKGDLEEMSLRVVMVSLGAILIIMGNYMPVIEQNSYMGARTPWTLKNEIVWKKTQRVGGIGFLLSGISTIILAFWRSEVALTVVIVEMLVMIVVIMLYSYVLYKKIENKKESEKEKLC